MRIVADTNIVISGLLWRGNERRILDAARDGLLALFTSPALLQELVDVLSREKFAKRLQSAQVTLEELCIGYAALATVIEAEPIQPVIIADPDDDVVLACALAAQCDVITSGDRHLLELASYEEIRILTASQLLMELAL